MKRNKRVDFPSEYKAVWMFAFFDLPVKTAEQRKRATRFRNMLRQLGFSQAQYSVYTQYYGCEANTEKHRKIIRKCVPPEGEVRLLHVTDRQFSLMEVYAGEIEKEPESRPQQLLLF
ncbi:CRISPR-associated endonuclease Cas2 [Desulfovibrio aminophilus]|uniref:CRISPR-associated endonuclease Cas2 n=1 Tax=Desulfovibrio aminophilus TaxID=81425 RepID=UPI003394F1BB